MTDGKKHNDFRIAIKLAFRDNWIFIVALGLISLVFGILLFSYCRSIHIQFESAAGMNAKNIGSLYKYFETGYGEPPANIFPAYVRSMNDNLSYILGFVLFFAVMKNFSFLFSKRKEDLFLALPIRRTATISAKMLVCFSMVVVVFGVQLIATTAGIVLLKNLGEFVKIAPLLNTIFQSFAFSTAVLALFVFCAVVSGRILHYVLLFGFALFSPAAFSLPSRLLGHYLPNLAIKIGQFSGDFTAYVYQMTRRISDTPVWICMVVSIILVVLSILFYKKRRAENAESRIAFRTPVAFSVLIVQVFGFFLAPLLFATFDKRVNYLLLFLICASVMAVFTLFGELILTKLRNKKTALIQYSVVTVALMGLSVCFVLANSSVTHKGELPVINDVEEVVYYEQQYANMNNGGLWLGSGQIWPEKTIKADSNIQKIYEIVEKSLYPEKSDEQNDRKICFKLKNGKNYMVEGSAYYLDKISDNEYAEDNEKFFATNLDEVDIMYVTANVSLHKSGLAIIRDKEEMKSIRNDMETKSKKITLSTEGRVAWGKIFLVKLNDNVPQQAKEELTNLTDEQLKWLILNSNGPFKEYGELVTGIVADGFCNQLVKEREKSSTMILEEEFEDYWQRRYNKSDDLQQYF